MSDIDFDITAEPIVITVLETNLQIIVSGGAGPSGPKGDDGAPGINSGETQVLSQDAPSNHWVINHTWIGGFPSVTVVDSSGNVVYGSVVYTSDTRIDIFFSAVFSGKVFLN